MHRWNAQSTHCEWTVASTLTVCMCVRTRVSKDVAVTPATVQCVMSGAGSKRLCQLLPQGNCGMLVCMCSWV